MSADLKKYLPPPYKKKRYYTMSEVALHNQANNCWVVLFGQVFDLTMLLQTNISSTRLLNARCIDPSVDRGSRHRHHLPVRQQVKGASNMHRSFDGPPDFLYSHG